MANPAAIKLSVREQIEEGLAKVYDLDMDTERGGLITQDEGRPAVGYVYLTGVGVGTNTIVINGRTYELDNAGSPTGDVAVDISADQTADAVITALVAAINADADRDVDAVAWAGNADTAAGATLVAKAVGATNFTLTETLANGVVSAAAFTGARLKAHVEHLAGEYTVTAQDVTTWALTGGNSVAIAGFAASQAPQLVSFQARTSAGAMVVLSATTVVTIVQVNSNFYVLTVDDGAADFTAADKISFHVIA